MAEIRRLDSLEGNGETSVKHISNNQAFWRFDQLSRAKLRCKARGKNFERFELSLDCRQ